MIDMNDATIIYTRRGHQVKKRINTHISQPTENGGYIAGYVDKMKIPSDPLYGNVRYKLMNYQRAVNQPFYSVFFDLKYKDEDIHRWYTTPYNSSDSVEAVFESGIIDKEVLSYFILHGYVPELKEIELPPLSVIRIIPD